MIPKEFIVWIQEVILYKRFCWTYTCQESHFIMNFDFNYVTINIIYLASKTSIYIIGSVSRFYYFVLVYNFLIFKVKLIFLNNVFSYELAIIWKLRHIQLIYYYVQKDYKKQVYYHISHTRNKTM